MAALNYFALPLDLFKLIFLEDYLSKINYFITICPILFAILN